MTVRPVPSYPTQWSISSEPRTIHTLCTRWLRGFLAGVMIFLCGGNTALRAAELRPETILAWDRYVTLTEARIERELTEGSRFLGLEFGSAPDAARERKEILAGDIPVTDLITRDEKGKEVDIPSGMIHHWRGYVFIPGATVDDLLASVKDPTRRREHRQEDVLESRVFERTGDSLRLYLKLQRKSIVTVAYNTEHQVHYRVNGPGRASSRSVATKIAEIEDLGTPDEREKPPGQDRGFMWRLNSYWRYEAVPGGVIVELESLTLSRELPWGLRFFIRPIIRRVARESIERTLAAMRTRFTTAQDSRTGP